MTRPRGGGGTAVPHYALLVAAGDEAAATPPSPPGTENRTTNLHRHRGDPSTAPARQRDPQNRRGEPQYRGPPYPCEGGVGMALPWGDRVVSPRPGGYQAHRTLQGSLTTPGQAQGGCSRNPPATSGERHRPHPRHPPPLPRALLGLTVGFTGIYWWGALTQEWGGCFPPQSCPAPGIPNPRGMM